MIACPNCSHINADDARFCAECQAPMQKSVLAERAPVTLSENALRALEARKRYLESAPSSADLSEQQWYNVCKFYPIVAKHASEFSNRRLAHVGPDNPLDKSAQPFALGFFLKRRGFPPPQREPGEEG
jgi:Double zinc ribbon